MYTDYTHACMHTFTYKIACSGLSIVNAECIQTCMWTHCHTYTYMHTYILWMLYYIIILYTYVIVSAKTVLIEIQFIA